MCVHPPASTGTSWAARSKLSPFLYPQVVIFSSEPHAPHSLLFSIRKWWFFLAWLYFPRRQQSIILAIIVAQIILRTSPRARTLTSNININLAANRLVWISLALHRFFLGGSSSHSWEKVQPCGRGRYNISNQHFSRITTHWKFQPART